MYYKPCGWKRYALQKENFQESYANWCVGYHGSMSKSIISILLRGLRQPGEEGVVVAHGQVHSKTKKSMYVSPSIEYAAFPCYAQLFRIADSHWDRLYYNAEFVPVPSEFVLALWDLINT